MQPVLIGGYIIAQQMSKWKVTLDHFPLQLSQDFCAANCILMDNFELQTIIWSWISLKPEKKLMITFLP